MEVERFSERRSADLDGLRVRVDAARHDPEQLPSLDPGAGYVPRVAVRASFACHTDLDHRRLVPTHDSATKVLRPVRPTTTPKPGCSTSQWYDCGSLVGEGSAARDFSVSFTCDMDPCF